VIAALLLALQVTTPQPIFSPPVSVSERTLLDRGLREAQRSAQRLGGTLGASVVDLTTGVDANLNGDKAFALADLRSLPLAVLALRQQSHVDLSALLGGSGEDYVLRELHGPDAVDASLHALSLDGIFIESHGGYASPNAIAHLLQLVASNTILDKTNAQRLLDTLQAAPSLRAEATIVHALGHDVIVVAILRDGSGTDAERAAVLSKVAREAVDAATATPGPA
jgi:hypothetical protein